MRMVGGVLLGRLVAPATLGLFNGIGLVLGYAPFLQLGIFNGLNRELPYFVGKGDRDRVGELASAALAWALTVERTGQRGLVCVAGWYAAHGELWKAAGWATNAVMAVFLFYNTNYLQMTYRTSHDFARLALAHVIESSVGLLMLIVVGLLNYYGLCLRALAISTVSTLFLYHWRPLSVGPKWNTGHLKAFVDSGCTDLRCGATVLLVACAQLDPRPETRRNASDRAVFHGPLSFVGCRIHPRCGLASALPRMSEHYGKGGSLIELGRMAVKPIIVSAIALVPLTAASWLVVGPAVRAFDPAYVDAVPTMR